MKKKLENIDKQVNFQVPEGYFENLPLQIQKRIDQEKNRSATYSIPSWSLAIAAMLAAILSFVFYFNDTTSSTEALLASVPEEDIISYLSNMEMTDYELITTLTNAEVEIEFEELNLLDGLELEGESFDDLLQEYNLENESLDI